MQGKNLFAKYSFSFDCKIVGKKFWKGSRNKDCKKAQAICYKIKKSTSKN